MRNHWEQGLCIKKMILEHKPSHILELGCLEGENTENLIKLAEEIDFKLTCISDDLEMKEDGVRRIRGISYKEIPKLEDKSIDFVLLDTDHNYWTMNQELTLLYPKLTYGALIVIHDVEYFYYNTGLAIAAEEGDSYADASEYPLNKIREFAEIYGGMSLAIIDWLHVNRFHYKLKTWDSTGVGICVLEKNPEAFQIVTVVPVSIGKGNRAGSRDELTQV